MLYKRKIDRLLIVVVPVGLFIYMSTRPHVRLRADMPPEFVDIQTPATQKQRAAEEKLAKGYWSLALTVIQWKYTYGSPLPDSPPEEFRVRVQPAQGSGTSDSSQARYWHKLQKVWLQPSSWVTSRDWSTDWLTGSITDGVNWLGRYIKDLIHGL